MAKRNLSIIFAFFLCLCLINPSVASVTLRRHHPLRYTVKPGDTLWGIAAKFLIKPWQWQALWEKNKHVRNPHILYPGNIIHLIHVNGRPYLRVKNGGTIKLSPKIRWEKFYTPIPTIPISDIKHYLSGSMIFNSKKQLSKLPYVLELQTEHVGGMMGSEFYARGLTSKNIKQYTIYKTGIAYRDPKTKRVLGYEAVEVGHAKLIKYGDPATFVITRQTQEIKPGNRLMPDKGRIFTANFMPRPPHGKIQGRIVAILDKGIQSIGHLFIVAINLGQCNDMKPGYVLTIKQPGKTIIDKFQTKSVNQRIKLPSSNAGEIMIFRTFKNMSYALVMQSTQLIHIGDIIETPNVS